MYRMVGCANFLTESKRHSNFLSLSFHPFRIEKLETNKKVGIQKLESKTTIVVFDELNCQLSPTTCGVVKDIDD